MEDPRSKETGKQLVIREVMWDLCPIGQPQCQRTPPNQYVVLQELSVQRGTIAQQVMGDYSLVPEIKIQSHSCY